MQKQLKNITEISMGYSFRTGIPAGSTGSIFVIQPKDINTFGMIIFDNMEKTDLKYDDKHVLSNGEVILMARGRFVASVYNGDTPTVVSSTFFRLKTTKKSGILPEYLALYLNSVPGQQQIAKRIEKTSIPTIKKTDIEDLVIPMIDMNIQKKLVQLDAEHKEWLVKHSMLGELQKTMINSVIIKITGANNG